MISPPQAERTAVSSSTTSPDTAPTQTTLPRPASMNSSPPISTVASGPGELSVLNTRKLNGSGSPTEPMPDFSIHMASQGGISTYWITP
ncbi:hypothetical protein D3C72_1505840 [compost metagenome]